MEKIKTLEIFSERVCYYLKIRIILELSLKVIIIIFGKCMHDIWVAYTWFSMLIRHYALRTLLVKLHILARNFKKPIEF